MTDQNREHRSDSGLDVLVPALLAAMRQRPDLAAAAANFARWLAAKLDEPAQGAAPRFKPVASHPPITLPTQPIIARPAPPAPAAPPPPPVPAAPRKPMVIELGGSRLPVTVHATGADDASGLWGSDSRRPADPADAGRPTYPAWTPRDSGTAGRDLPTLAKRARIKAEACRWLQQRRKAGDVYASLPAPLQEQLNVLLDRAKLIPNCYVWMVRPGHEVESDEAIEHAAAAYENVALTADLLQEASDEDADDISLDLLHLAAEAQSALRNTLPPMNWDKEPDQLQMFYWLRDYAEQHRTFIARHMKLDDPADPEAAGDLRCRLEEHAAAARQQRHAVQRRKDLVSHVRYQARALSQASDDEQRRQALERLDHFLGQWVDLGLPPTDRNIREAVLPIIAAVPADATLTTGATRVFKAAREFAASANGNGLVEAPDRAKSRPEHVRQAAELLRDRVAVFVGGEERADQRQRLQRDLELREVRWVPTLEHESLARLEPDVTRPDVDIVLLAIRLTSHSHGDLKRICEEHGKVFVTLPAGWNPSQVADQVLNQASDRLRQRRRVSGPSAVA